MESGLIETICATTDRFVDTGVADWPERFQSKHGMRSIDDLPILDKNYQGHLPAISCITEFQLMARVRHRFSAGYTQGLKLQYVT